MLNLAPVYEKPATPWYIVLMRLAHPDFQQIMHNLRVIHIETGTVGMLVMTFHRDPMDDTDPHMALAQTILRDLLDADEFESTATYDRFTWR